jgi:signal transduction histidine kinase
MSRRAAGDRDDGRVRRRFRRWPAVLAVALVVLGIVATAVRLDAPSDGSMARFTGGSVLADVPGDPQPGGLRPGDDVVAIHGNTYELRSGETRTVALTRPDPYPLLAAGWGDLVFVIALAVLAVALYLRRPGEPATPPLLVAAAALFGSTFVVVAGLPVRAFVLATPQNWLFWANTVFVYAIAWGAVLVMSLRFVPDHPWASTRVVRVAAVAPLATMAALTGILAVLPGPAAGDAQAIVSATSALVLAVLLAGIVIGAVGYRRTTDRTARDRLRWVAAGGLAAAVIGIAGWHLPALVTGEPLFPVGALGLSALPFVAGIAVALRRHRLFDIERLANRSLVYAAVVTVLVAVYTATVAVLAAVLRISDGIAAALAAAVAALVLAPLRATAQGLVNRVMYGHRDDPAAVLAGLGGRLQTVMLPGDVSPTVVDTVARSLRVPYVAIDLCGPDGDLHVVAEHGVPVGAVHAEPLVHYGETVGRLRVSGRGVDDPLEEADLVLIRSLAQQVGPAVQAVRLHHDLVRSRAEVVALREDERRRLRRELHDGLGPALAAIALKAGLAARDVPAGQTRELLGEITDEVRTSLADVRRVVDALRPPAIDELGLVGAVRARAAALTGDLIIEVDGPPDRAALPAAVETAGYRIAVEAMTNAVRHSTGRRVTVRITVDDHDVLVVVRDDGTGLAADRNPGVGLRSMQERAAELGGSCRITGTGGGTEVRARLPLRVGVAS